MARRIIFDTNQKDTERNGTTFVGDKGASSDTLRPKEVEKRETQLAQEERREMVESESDESMAMPSLENIQVDELYPMAEANTEQVILNKARDKGQAMTLEASK